MFYFILPQAMSHFSNHDNLLLFVIAKNPGKKNKRRFYVFYSSYTSFSVFHCPLPTAIAHFRLLSNYILDRALGLSFFFTILAEFDRHLLPQFCHFSYLVPHCTVSWLFIILPSSQNTDYKLKIYYYHFS